MAGAAGEHPGVNIPSCPDCGAPTSSGESCADRFSRLLALDHSRQEPWGSRHGLAFAAYTLQHPSTQAPEVLRRSWTMLCRVYLAGDDRDAVARGMRRVGGGHVIWDVPAPPPTWESGRGFPVTIADLGDFDAASYASRLDAWCLGILGTFGYVGPAPSRSMG